MEQERSPQLGIGASQGRGCDGEEDLEAAENASKTLCTIVLQKRSIRRFVTTEKAPTRAFSWLKAATTAFTFKTLLKHYAKRT